MAKYYVEIGPVHRRTFIDIPPARPQGPVIEITEDTWQTLKDTHPSFWQVNGNTITNGKPLPPKKMDPRLIYGLKLVIALVIGFILGRL